ncbi:MAG TPA: phytase [Chitinophagaceae bacterium]|jgi:3-phytase|nr:phytase [Chitinophagaceae bacterium]
MIKNILPLVVLAFVNARCTQSKSASVATTNDSSAVASIKPVVVTEEVQFDTDDPALWINVADTAKSLIVGTDKDENGGLYVFDLTGKIIPDKTVKLKRPNNVDIEYGLILNNHSTDIAVATERLTHKLRIFSLPDMKSIDNGGIEMFEGETGNGFRDLMGISLYKNPTDKKIYAMVGRKTGPTEGSYIWQYLLEDNGKGQVKATLVRKFGKYSGKKEIESIAVDDELGYVYYSDEGVGVHKYYAEPSKGNEELALFATTNFAEDHEGISIYKINDGTGYILVSDQGGNNFNVYPREGTTKGPHDHPLIKIIPTSTQQSDGSEVTSISFPGQFKSGLFVGMSTDKTFQLYRWEDLAGKDLMIAPNGIPLAKK